MTNEYGLDVNYFKDKLFLIVRDVDRYTPAEMKRELERLMKVAEHQEKVCTNQNN